MAALSVHMARDGTKGRTPASLHIPANRSRSNELAATPPPRHAPTAPVASTAHRALVTSASTTAAWNEAATSAEGASGSLRTWLTTAVFRPLNEKE